MTAIGRQAWGRARLGVSLATPEALRRARPALGWLAHLGEMVVVMLIGMEVLFGEASAIAAALGVRDLMTDEPELATAIMALTMAVPMALWMHERGHHRRGVVEMTLAMLVPAVVVLAAGRVVGVDLTGAYHPLMYAAMIGLMVYRRDEYAHSGHH